MRTETYYSHLIYGDRFWESAPAPESCSGAHSHSVSQYHSPPYIGRQSFELGLTLDISLDVSIVETVVALARGACICMPTEKERLEGTEDFIRCAGANWAFFTPSVARTLVPSRLPGLKTVVFGGEGTSREIASTWWRGRRLINSYGPCEASIWFSFAEVPNGEIDVRNVGVPDPAYSKGHVVSPEDPNVLISGQGIATGELLIEGPNVVRGYLNDEERSSAAFISPPAWSKGSDREPSRFYLTGDLVERCEDESFRILGRKDRQVKIRGQKVDLDEIRHHFLSETATIQDFVPVFEGFSASQKQRRHELVAFVVPRDRSVSPYDGILAPMTTELRADLKSAYETLRGVIPAFLLPTLFVPISRVPLTAHSKADTARLSLTLSGLSRAQERKFNLYQRDFKPLRSNDEERILGLAISRELGLPVSEINANDGFLQLGGDSVKAMSLVTFLHQRGRHLSIRDIMSPHSLGEMALCITPLDNFEIDQLVPAAFSLLPPGTSAAAVRLQAAEACGVAEDVIIDVFPCTALQVGFIGVSARDPRANIARYVFELGSSIQEKRLRGAWEATFSRIQVLRTRFFLSTTQGLLQAVINEPAIVHTRKGSPDLQGSDSDLPFEIGGPMVRASVYSLESEDKELQYLVLTMHHAIIDLFTLRLIVKTLEASYRNKSLPPVLPFQVGILERIDSPTIVEHQEFWSSSLAGSPTLLWPPPVAVSSMTRKTTWARCARSLPLLRLCGRAEGQTLSTYIQAAWALLVGTYAASEDVVYGLVVSGRESDGCDASTIAGPMLATCPLRLPFSQEMTIAQLLHLTRQTVAGLSRYAHFGLQNIVKLGPDEKRASALQTLLVVQPEMNATETLDIDMKLDKTLSRQESLSSYACWVECVPQGDQLRLNLEYLPEAIGSGEVILQNLEHILCALADSRSDRPIASLSLLAVTEPAHVSHPRHEASMAMLEQTVHEYILNVGRHRPEEMAVVGWDGSFTYRQIDQLSHKLALQLQKSGVDVGTFVPVCAAKSVWVVIGLLAILRAGGIYVPLDTKSPPARHQEIVSQFQSPVVLVSPNDSRLWPERVKYLIDMNASFTTRFLRHSHTEQEESPNDLPVVPPDAVSYCFFTSGTTGAPKGVLIQHRAHLTSALSRLSQFERYPGSRVLQVSAFAYDLSVEDICTTLYAGGTVVMPSEDERLNDIVGAINRYTVNNINVTPSFASLLHPDKVPSLEVLVIGGEVPSAALYETWTSSTVHIINAYGPTECCNWSTVTRAVSSDTRNIGWITCGRAWLTHPENPQVRMPLGAVGELLLEGPMLAREYLGNERATSEAFVTGLQWAQPDSRFYRTGDLVRSNQDGSFTFVRRRDHQVKINGIRVELGEIESKILSSGGEIVKDVCVDLIAVEGKQTIVAFCVPVTAKAPEQWPIRLLEKLQHLLPPSLIPSLVIPLNVLPMGLTGKRDRKQLRGRVEQATMNELRQYRVAGNKPSFVRHATPDQNQKSTGLVEAALAKAWAEVLDMPSGVDIIPSSNFFNIGGDSVIAMRLVSLCREQKMVISVPDIYEWPRLCDLASFVHRSTASSTKHFTAADFPAPFSMLGPWRQHSKVLAAVHEMMPDVEIEDVYPCTAFQEGIMALSALQPGSYVAEHRFRWSAHSGHEAAQRLRQACRDVIAANSILRTRMMYVDGEGLFQVVLYPEHSDTTLPNAASEIVVRPWEPCSPLSQLEVLNSEDGRVEIVCYASHAVFDAFTWDLICKQINIACHSTTPPLTVVPYSGFVSQIRQNNRSISKKFWSKQLDGAVPVNLFPASQHRVEKMRVWDLDIDNAPGSVRVDNITDATRLHVAWALVIARFTSSGDVVFGSVLSQRILDIARVDETMGPCIATVPVRLQLGSHANTRQALLALQQYLVGAMPHLGLGLTEMAATNEAACNFDSLITVFPPPTYGTDSPGHVVAVSNKPAFGFESGYYTHPLVLEVQPTKSRLLVKAVYDSSVASEYLVGCLVNTFAFAYERLRRAECADVGLADIDLCSPRDKQIIKEWSKPHHSSSACSTVPELVSSQAKLRPQKTAIEAWDGDLTYEEVDHHSSRLAAYMQQRFGEWVDAVCVIPMCFSRSRWVPVVMLAIQKMRKAYTALDPAFPSKRLSQLVRQLQAKLVVVDSDNLDRFDAEVVFLVNQELIDSLPTSHSDLRDPPLLLYDPAIVLFTSGSTGTPKTILLQQKAVVSAITGFGPRMDFGPETRALQNAAFAFDIHACEIFLTLAHGGCLVISNADRSQLAHTVRTSQVNWLFMTPSTMHLLSGPNEVPSVKTLMMIGEAPTKTIIQTWARPREELHLINAYGPAENTLFSTMRSINSPTCEPSNIGRSINTRTWIVDPSDSGRLVPVGSVGELVLQGAQLAWGYLQQPEETAKAFFTNPAWVDTNGLDFANERFYKTGDLVRYEVDGTLSIIGRVDAQTKLNGQRLELGEVEYHVSRMFPENRVAAEIVEPLGGPRSLAVFVALSGASTPSSSLSVPSKTVVDGQNNEGGAELLPPSSIMRSNIMRRFAHCRQELADCLPSFMVPSLFIPVDRLPQTASNKLDRKSLRNMVSSVTFEQLNSDRDDSTKGAQSLVTKEPPRTHAQFVVRDLWARVLGMSVEKIGIDDHFFRNGGDSIRAIRLATLLSKESVGADPIPVASIFEKPQLKNMATLLESVGGHLIKPLAIEPLVQLTSARLDLIRITQKARDELLQYCAASLETPEDSIQDAYPCTPLQEAMLAASALAPNAYVMEQQWELEASVDINKLEDAWRLTVERFDILRTRFVSTPALGTLQVVMKPIMNRSVFQSRDVKDGDDRNELSILKIESAAKGKSRLVWRAHHALFDQWTLMMVIESVEKAYKGVIDDHAPAPFKIFVRYLAEEKNERAAESGAFWREYLRDVTPTPFPNKPSAPSVSSKDHGRVTLKTSITDAHGVTAAIIARAAWAMVISKYTNADTVAFGTTLSGRNAPLVDIESIYGPTITTVPVRVRIDEGESIGSFLETMQSDAAAMMPHEHYNLQEIRQLSEEMRELTNFPSLLVVQPAWAVESGGEIVMQPVENDSATSQYHTLPLVIEYSLDGSSSLLEAHFDTDVISHTGMMRILRQIEQVAHQLQDCDARTLIRELEFLSKYDQDQISKWNQNRTEIVNDFIDDIIAEQTARRPDVLAICSHDGDLTYAQLDEEASRMATLLTSAYNIGSEDIVPLVFEKSMWAMVAMLAVLKAGAAFVPTDPAQSIGRLNEIIHQIEPKIILVSEQTDGYAYETTALRVVVNAGAWQRRLPYDKAQSDATRRTRSPSDLAYIIFTSGSTGKPKGVMIQHNSYLTGARPRRYVLARDENARVIQFSTYSFDTSIEDTLTTWGYGGCVCIPSEDERLNDLEGVMNRMRVTCAHLTPSLTAALEPANIPTLRHLHFGGEKMTGSALRRWSQTGMVDVRNVYGPTESSISTTITSRLDPTSDPSNTGFAVGCNVWIADARDHDRLVPVGCTGELLIEGHVLARGYFKNPEKTAEAFIDNPEWSKTFGLAPGAERGSHRRFYKTGDVAKYADNGSIICLGRKDAQVKLNGNRIEIGDVETNLWKILDGKIDDLAVEVVVPKKKNPSHTPILVAFIAIGSYVSAETSADGRTVAIVLDSQAARRVMTTTLTSTGVVERMRAMVPSYMVPTAFVPLGSIPQSIAKKTDRTTLQKLVSDYDAHELRSFFDQDVSIADAGVAMMSPGMDVVRDLCSVVLSREKSRVKASDSFIGLGGDSILALRFVAAARRRGFGGLTVVDTLRAASLSDIAKFYSIDNVAAKQHSFTEPAPDLVVEVSAQLRVSVEDLEILQRATGFEHEAFEASLLPERGYMNSFTFTLDGPVHLHRLEHACERLIARHGALRTVFIKRNADDLYHVTLRYKLSDSPRLQYFDTPDFDGQMMMPEPGYGKPTVKFSAIKRGEKTDVVLCLSHALYDGMSFGVLCQDLSRAYQGLPFGDVAPQFDEFSRELSSTTTDFETQRAWTTLLQGARMTELVGARNAIDGGPKSGMRRVEDSEVSTTFSCQGTGNFTFASVLKAAWASVLARNRGVNDVVFGHVVSTRPLVGSSTDGLIGPCLEFIPIRVRLAEVGKLADGDAARELLESVQNQHIEGMPHHRYGYRNIVRKCTLWGSSTRMPTFVQHRSQEESPAELIFQDGQVATVQTRARPYGLCDLWVVTAALGGGDVKVTLSYSSCVFEADMVRMLMHELVTEIHRLCFLHGRAG
ncbi:acetyl-CoA synthetase-like protein [Xylariaceae sp. FL0255]|nr:acetyl-CoA synthetase-like protein [Xylariaceae sp. FL0255]